jgi:hypothetical protein
MVFVQQGFSSNLLVFTSSYFEWLYYVYSERQFLRFAGCIIYEWKGLSVAGPAALFTNWNDNVCLGSHCTFTNRKDAVLRGPLHYSLIETAARWTSHCTLHKWKGPCVAGPSALGHRVLRGPAGLFKTKRTVYCGAHGTIYKRKEPCVVAGPAALFKTARTVCCGAHGIIHKWKVQCVAGPTALFPNGKDSVLRGPRHYSQMERTVCSGAHGTIHKQ